MSRGNPITKEEVLKAKEYAEKYDGVLTRDEIAKLCGRSTSTLGRILAGDHDYLLEGKKEAQKPSAATSEEQLQLLRKETAIVSERLSKTYNLMVETYGGSTLDDVVNELCRTNHLLSQLIFILCNWEDPSHVKEKRTAAHFRDEVHRAMKR